MRKPILQALLLADHVYVDASSQKAIIAGTFDRLRPATFPCLANCFAYIAMTECTGELALNFRLFELSTNEILIEMSLLVDAGDDPLNKKEFILAMKHLHFPRPGHYGFGVFWNDEQLGMLRLLLAPKADFGAKEKS